MRWLYFPVLLAVAGCVKIPMEEAACQMLPTPSLGRTAELALDSSAFEEEPLPSKCFWEMFDDPQLEYLLCKALEENPTLMKVKARIESAEAEAKIKRSRLFPTLGISMDLNWQYYGENDFFRAFAPTFPGYIPEYEIGVDFSYEFDFWGKHRNIYRAALGIAKAEEAEMAHAQLIVASSVATVYFKLQALLQKLSMLQEERELLTRQIELTQERIEHALDDKPQLLKANERLYALDQFILFTSEALSLARHTLNQLLGQGPESIELIETLSIQKSRPFPMPTELGCDLLARRPDLMAQIWRVEAAAHLVGAAKADFYPNVNLFALAGLDSVFFSKWFSWGSRTGAVRPAFHLPIFTAGRLKANLSRHRAEFEQAIYAYNETLLRAAKEVADQVVVLKTANENLDLQETLVRWKKENASISKARLDNALDDLPTFLNAKEAVIQEKMREIQFSYERNLAAVELIRALGGGYCNENNPLGDDGRE